jgi:hypothetical protein
MHFSCLGVQAGSSIYVMRVLGPIMVMLWLFGLGSVIAAPMLVLLLWADAHAGSLMLRTVSFSRAEETRRRRSIRALRQEPKA